MKTRKDIKATSVTQSNNASSINNTRGMARRAKRQSHKTMRQLFNKVDRELIAMMSSAKDEET